jgi:hypothetical protein
MSLAAGGLLSHATASQPDEDGSALLAAGQLTVPRLTARHGKYGKAWALEGLRIQPVSILRDNDLPIPATSASAEGATIIVKPFYINGLAILTGRAVDE